MKRVLFTSCNSIASHEWKHILSLLGKDAYFISLNPASIPSNVRQQIDDENILSTEGPFYSGFGSFHETEYEPINDSQFELFQEQIKRTLYAKASHKQVTSLWLKGINYWKRLLLDLHIERIFFTQFPHTGGDFILSKAAESLGIPAITSISYSLDNLAIVKKGYWHSANLLCHKDLDIPVEAFHAMGKSALKSFTSGSLDSLELQSISQFYKDSGDNHSSALIRSLDYSSFYCDESIRYSL